MKFKVLFLIIFSLTFNQSTFAKENFNIVPSSNKIGEGQCHMDYCSWAKIIKNTIVHKDSEKTRVKSLLLGGQSYHRDHYPQSGTIPKNIKWNKKPHYITVECSYINPKVMIDGQVDELDFQMVPAILESTANLYFQVCHNHYDGYSSGIEKFKYE